MSELDRDDDLLIRGRRRELLEGEDRRLREALAGSSATRLLFEAGSAFDREAPVMPGDDERIERLLRAVQGRNAGKAGAGEAGAVRAAMPSRRVWYALAVGMLLGGVAVAAIEGGISLLAPRATASKTAQVSEAAGAAVASRTAQVERSAITTDDGDHPVARTVEPSTARAGGSARVRSSAPRTVESSAPAPIAAEASAAARFEDVTAGGRVVTAGELFASANRARVHGDAERATEIYRRLESEFPGSSEALTARLSLGLLYLHAGQAGRALEEFRAYRALGRGATLGEALWGESQALHQLGRKDEERAVLTELLDRFPGSAYAAAARKRLGER